MLISLELEIGFLIGTQRQYINIFSLNFVCVFHRHLKPHFDSFLIKCLSLKESNLAQRTLATMELDLSTYFYCLIRSQIGWRL